MYDLERLEKIDSDSLIVLYGIGNQFNACYEYLKKRFDKFSFIDSNPKKSGNFIDNIEIKRPDSIYEIKKEKSVFFVSSIMNQFEISETLTEMYGVPKDRIFCYVSETYFDNVLDHKKLLPIDKKIEDITELLEDQESKKYFLGSFMMRKYRQPLYIKPNINIKNIGFYENAFTLEKGDVIIDGGAYTGDTARRYVYELNEQCKVFALEPFEDNFNQMKELISENNWENIIIPYKVAISDFIGEKELIYSNEDFKMAINLFEKEGTNKEIIKVETLDHLFGNLEKIDFIKMDIEGSELEALKGATNIIKKHKPKLLISAYHKIEDFLEIPIFIKNINPDYKIYVGHAPGVSMEMEYFIC